MTIRIAIGVCGSGKSYLLKTLVAEEMARGDTWRFLVLDVNSEWPGEPADLVSSRTGRPLDFYLARTPHEALELFQQGAQAVVLRPADLSRDEEQSRELADACAWVCLQVGPRLPAGQGCCLVLPEMHEYSREGRPLPVHVKTIVHRFRHTRTGLLGDTQHTQDVKKEVFREAETVYFFSQSHPTDLAKVERYGGPELVAAVKECARRYAEGGGQGGTGAGWRIEYHQNLGGPPPFEPQR